MGRKDLSKIMEAHGIYVATALPCFPADVAKKIQKARDIEGPAFVHMLCPCPTGWEHDPAIAVELARLAYETGAWVLYEYENGQRTITRAPKTRKPIEVYLKKQGRFSHLTQGQIVEIQKAVDERFDELVGSARLSEAI
jgi:pyruvate ferredoxin oxidoreductase beta subunit